MGRFSGGMRTTGAGSTTLPLCALCGTASGGGKLREITVWNTTTTAVALKLMRITTAGTPGAATIVEAPWDKQNEGAPVCALFDTYTSTAPTAGDDLGIRITLPGAVGAGATRGFGDTGIIIPAGTANGIALVAATGAGQIVDVDWVWDE